MNASPLLLAGFMIVSMVFLLWSLAETAKNARRDEVLAQLEQYSLFRAKLVATEKRHVVREVLQHLSTLVVTQRQRRKLHDLLDRAGQHDFDDVEAMARRKVAFTVGFGLIMLLGAVRGGATWFAAMPLVSLGGYFLPEVLVYNTALKRTEEIAFALPDSVDLLSMCVESGLGFEAALAKVTETQKGPVAEEFGAVLAEIQMGKSRNEALAGVAKRNRQVDLIKFINAVQQVDRLGVPVSGMLQEQSREMRNTRRERAREQAQKVPVKILMPVMACFLPGIFIIILGPALLSIVGGLSFGS